MGKMSEMSKWLEWLLNYGDSCCHVYSSYVYMQEDLEVDEGQAKKREEEKVYTLDWPTCSNLFFPLRLRPISWVWRRGGRQLTSRRHRRPTGVQVRSDYQRRSYGNWTALSRRTQPLLGNWCVVCW